MFPLLSQLQNPDLYMRLAELPEPTMKSQYTMPDFVIQPLEFDDITDAMIIEGLEQGLDFD